MGGRNVVWGSCLMSNQWLRKLKESSITTVHMHTRLCLNISRWMWIANRDYLSSKLQDESLNLSCKPLCGNRQWVKHRWEMGAAKLVFVVRKELERNKRKLELYRIHAYLNYNDNEAILYWNGHTVHPESIPFTFSTLCYVPALFQNGLNSFFPSKLYTQYPIMTKWKKFCLKYLQI